MPGGPDHPTFPQALAVAGNLARGRGDRELARRLCDDALAAEQRLGVEPSPFVHMTLYNIAMSDGRRDDQVGHAVRVVELAQASGDPVFLAYGLAGRALGRAMGGDTAGAFADAEAAMTVARRLANPYIVQTPMAAAAFAVGNADPARGLAMAREILALDPRQRTMFPLSIVGELAERNGEHAEALEHLLAALQMMQWQTIRWGAGTVLVRIGTILVDRDPEAAAVLDGAGEALATGFVHHGDTTAARERAVAVSTAALGGTRRAELYALGFAMSDDESLAYAVDAVDRYLAAESEE
jgi:hypothetical protein